MSELPDRPATLRRPPRPAADEATDPVDYVGSSLKAEAVANAQHPEETKASASTPSAFPKAQSTGTPSSNDNGRSSTTRVRSGRPANREITSPFSTQLALDVHDLIETAAYETGQTKRAIIEESVRKTFGHLAD